MKKFWMDISLISKKIQKPLPYPQGVKIFGDTKKEVYCELKKVKDSVKRVYGNYVEVTAGRIYECKEIIYDANNAM
jgi:hypothetical protein